MSDVKRYLPSQIPSCSYNAPEYVLAADFDRLRAENERLREALRGVESWMLAPVASQAQVIAMIRAALAAKGDEHE